MPEASRTGALSPSAQSHLHILTSQLRRDAEQQTQAIRQYEAILGKMNGEFEQMLQRNLLLESALKECEGRLNTANEQLRKQSKQLLDEKESGAGARAELKEAKRRLFEAQENFKENCERTQASSASKEDEMRTKIEELLYTEKKLLGEVRLKTEEGNSLAKDNLALKNELRKVAGSETQLKYEVAECRRKREEAEERLQESVKREYNGELVARKTLADAEKEHRENAQMKELIELMDRAS